MWLKDAKHGYGKLYIQKTQSFYEGDFVNNRMEGFGK
jgi:hypothetical protein